MRIKMLEWLLAGLLICAAGSATAADADGALAGTWSLDDRSSDDPVRKIQGEHAGNGLARQVVRSINVFGFPVGSVLPGDEEEKEDPPAPQDVLGALSYVFEATYKLRITQDGGATEIRYGNTPSMIYRDSDAFESNGWKSKVEIRNGAVTIEHERVDGARVSERYWVEKRADELHWTARFKHPKSRAVDVKRVFYRAPSAESANAQLTARLSR